MSSGKKKGKRLLIPNKNQKLPREIIFLIIPDEKAIH